MTESTPEVPSGDLTARLDAGPVICAEGFLFELERRGYLSAGEFVPEVALEYPDALRALHVDFQRAGSDVVEAFTYNGHREKMRVIGKEDLLEPLNRAALQIAREVADQRPGDLMAGNISNTNIWDPEDTARQAEVRGMFEEMVGWAVEGGADMIIGETFYYAGEALAALEVAKATGLPVVITIAPMAMEEMADGVGIVETCQRLEQAGAAVVGMNCFRGPETMLPWLKQIRAAVSCHVGALPIPYRTTAEEPTFFNLTTTARGCPRRTAAPSRPRWTRCTPTGTRSAPSPRRSTTSASTTSASAAVPRPCWSARSRRRSGSPPRPAGSPRTCATTSCTATTSGYPSTSSRSATRPSRQDPDHQASLRLAEGEAVGAQPAVSEKL